MTKELCYIHLLPIATPDNRLFMRWQWVVAMQCHAETTTKQIQPLQVRARREGNTRKALQADVMHNLVIASLQEGGVDGSEGHDALCRQSSCKCHCMLQHQTHARASAYNTIQKATARIAEVKSDFREPVAAQGW